MASRSAGTLLTEFNATFVPPALMPGYQGHVPGVASSFGSPYGNTTFKYFQDHRNASMEKSYAVLSGGRFPTIFSPNPSLVLSDRSQTWDRWLHLPTYTRFNLDRDRFTAFTDFYRSFGSVGQLTSYLKKQPKKNHFRKNQKNQSEGSLVPTKLPGPRAAQKQRKYYQDKTGLVSRVPYFILPVRERDRYPLPTDLPPLTEKNKWHLLRVSPDYVRTYQTFPSGKRVSSQERQKRDCYFEFRA